MMDAKTAVEILESLSQTENFVLADIADFIEQQAKEIVKLTDDNGQQHIEIMLLTRKKNEQEKYAELGRLVVKYPDGICNSTQYDKKWSTCRQCRNFEACQKRAELLEGDKNG